MRYVPIFLQPIDAFLYVEHLVLWISCCTSIARSTSKGGEGRMFSVIYTYSRDIYAVLVSTYEQYTLFMVQLARKTKKKNGNHAKLVIAEFIYDNSFYE